MKRRTEILASMIDAAQHLDSLQESLNQAFLALESRLGAEARDAFAQVVAARDEAYEPRLEALIETAITLIGRMP